MNNKNQILADEVLKLGPLANLMMRNCGIYGGDDLLQATACNLLSRAVDDSVVVDKEHLRRFVRVAMRNARDDFFRRPRVDEQATRLDVDTLNNLIDHRSPNDAMVEVGGDFFAEVDRRLSGSGRLVLEFLRERHPISWLGERIGLGVRSAYRFLAANIHEIRTVMSDVGAERYGTDAWEQFLSDVRANIPVS
jgi:hypothetical protein